MLKFKRLNVAALHNITTKLFWKFKIKRIDSHTQRILGKIKDRQAYGLASHFVKYFPRIKFYKYEFRFGPPYWADSMNHPCGDVRLAIVDKNKLKDFENIDYKKILSGEGLTLEEINILKNREPEGWIHLKFAKHPKTGRAIYIIGAQGKIGSIAQLREFSSVAGEPWVNFLVKSLILPAYSADFERIYFMKTSRLPSFIKEKEDAKYWQRVLRRHRKEGAVSDDNLSQSGGRLRSYRNILNTMGTLHGYVKKNCHFDIDAGDYWGLDVKKWLEEWGKELKKH